MLANKMRFDSIRKFHQQAKEKQHFHELFLQFLISLLLLFSILMYNAIIVEKLLVFFCYFFLSVIIIRSRNVKGISYLLTRMRKMSVLLDRYKSSNRQIDRERVRWMEPMKMKIIPHCYSI